jgi:hypothetical protein
MATDYSLAKCIGNTDLFFKETYPEIDMAKKLCHDCPVKRQCLTESLERLEPYGVWGGLTYEERRMLCIIKGIKPPTRKEEVEHGTTRGYEWHKRTGVVIDYDDMGKDSCGCATANREASRQRMVRYRKRKRITNTTRVIE